MKLLARTFSVSKSPSEIFNCIKSFAYCPQKATFGKNSFSVYCAKRRCSGYFRLYRLSGTFSEENDQVIVSLEIHAETLFFIGYGFIIFGILGLICCLITGSDRWIPCLGSIVIGGLVDGWSVCEAIEVLDLAEHQLTC